MDASYTSEHDFAKLATYPSQMVLSKMLPQFKLVGLKNVHWLNRYTGHADRTRRLATSS